jgi:hypothetical protein
MQLVRREAKILRHSPYTIRALSSCISTGYPNGTLYRSR